MATINEIANAATYKGDISLGGGYNNVIDIDIKPLQDLAKYTVIYQQAEYQQRQKDAEARALELADIAKVDFASIEPKWRDEIAAKYKEVTDYAAGNPEVFNYQKNPQGYLEYQKKKNELMQAANAGKQNQILLTARKQAIANATDVNLKNVLQKELDAAVSKTGLYTPLPVEQKYDLTFKPLATPQQLTFDVIQVNPNDNTKRSYKITDMGQVNAQANLVAFDDIATPLDKTSEAFISATPQEQERLIAQESRNSVLRKSGWMKMGDIAQSILSDDKYKTDGKVDVNLLLADSKTAPLANLVMATNAKILAEKNKIESGFYKEKNGNTVIFDNKILKESDYVPIDITDGISGVEVAKIMMLASAPSEAEKTDVQQTDNAIQSKAQRDANALGWAKLGLDRDEFGLKQKQFESTQKGTQPQINGAVVRGNKIYADLLKLAGTDGIISPDEVRKLNVEQLKYLGTEQPEERNTDGKVLQSAGFRPLSFQENVPYIIRLEKGNIQVMEGAKKIPDGRYEGKWSPTKSTTLRNIWANVLGEELKNSGSKELNSYTGVDITGEATTFSDATTTTSKSTSNQTTQPVVEATRRDYINAGWTRQQIDNALKAGKIKIK